MTLTRVDGTAFTTGTMLYEYRPATSAETTPRVVLPIAIGNYEISAFVDTGGVFFICAPDLAQKLRLEPDDGIPIKKPILWRGRPLKGTLHTLAIKFLAIEGHSLIIEVTAFVPTVSSADEADETVPCVLGMQGCLEKMRFAVDPENDLFYFGSLGEG